MSYCPPQESQTGFCGINEIVNLIANQLYLRACPVDTYVIVMQTSCSNRGLQESTSLNQNIRNGDEYFSFKITIIYIIP